MRARRRRCALASAFGLRVSATRQQICAHRRTHGAFTTRAQLRDVKGVGAKTFEQAVGFLRIYGGAQSLDETGTRCCARGCAVQPT